MQKKLSYNESTKLLNPRELYRLKHSYTQQVSQHHFQFLLYSSIIIIIICNIARDEWVCYIYSMMKPHVLYHAHALINVHVAVLKTSYQLVFSCYLFDLVMTSLEVTCLLLILI